ncbi:Prolipoprotein diacylglyceryl transferase [[Mycoplasma] cavipharyngis]|uniref:prolipoprotein diacylglyceryl transferase n=1 Tax=[Mycoplasma] cavipharyngis TaxID=92757 RepID=UPI0037046355
MGNGFNGINGSSFGLIGHIGSLPVTIYGFLVVSGFIIAVILCSIKLTKFYRVSYDPFLKFAVIAFPLGIVSASIWSYAIGNSNQWYAGFTGTGGLAIQGGVFIGTLFGLIWFPLILKKAKYWINVPLGKEKEVEAVRRVSTWIFFDAIVPVVLIGQAIGRWGNFFNYEVFGLQVGNLNYADAITAIENGNTNLVPLNWLRVVMPGVWSNMWISTTAENSGSFANPSSNWATTAFLHHPLFLYESFFNIIVFSIIYNGFINTIPKFKVGIIGGVAIFYTGLFRTVTEKLRFSSASETFSFNQSFVFSIILLIIGLLVIFYAIFVAGRKDVRHVRWFEYLIDFFKLPFYRWTNVRLLMTKYSNYQDQLIGTSLTQKIHHDIERLKNKTTIKLTDYVVGYNELKYYGFNYFNFFGRKIWFDN